MQAVSQSSFMVYHGSSRASLVVNTVKNLPVMWETQVQSLGQEGPQGKGVLQYSCLENSMDRGAWKATVDEIANSGHNWSTNTFTFMAHHCHLFFSVLYLGNIIQIQGASLVAQWLRICLQCRRCRFNPWVRKIPWKRAWQSTPVFLPGESHGLRSLVVYSS